MKVLRYDKYGNVEYYIQTYPGYGFLKVFKRLDKNTYEICSLFPKSLKSKVTKIRMSFLIINN